jgi:tetratricopeptide (TPR) repeat protein
MLDLVVKAGGTIEENQPTLEFMARDLAAQIPALKKAGQIAEAKAMGDGLAILLKRLGAIPNLTPASILFLGQTLYLVEQYDDSLKEFAKIGVPVPPKGAMPNAAAVEWWKVDTNKLENNPDKKKFLEAILDYRPAQLYTARCLRGQSKFGEAEQLLMAAIGLPEKQGYAYANRDFRRELALVYEAKGAASTDLKAAKDDWGKAYKEWNTLFVFARNDVTKLKDPTPEQEKQVKNQFFDTFFELQRCVLQANSQLLKGNASLAKTFTDVGKKLFDLETLNKFAELEKKGTSLISPEVWTRYCDLLERYPELKNAYKAAGGKFFLERPKEE